MLQVGRRSEIQQDYIMIADISLLHSSSQVNECRVGFTLLGN